ncbi:MAG: redoxin family protein [Chloroflexi bacterium]|nr:redoxin family protein [Chloroflexota bacterium]
MTAAFAGVVALVVTSCGGGNGGLDPVQQESAGSTAAPSATPREEEPELIGRGVRAPELRGIVGWLNSEPLTLAELRGKVVLIDFWTYTCINCVRTFPFLREWNEKYADEGLVIIGVHTPEFAFERELNNVREAAQRHMLTYPIALDNDYATWNAFQNRYWPRKYLIDKDGFIRYDHAGEGRYEATENVIKRLLAEIGADVQAEVSVTDPQPGPLSAARLVTRELYAGLRGALSGQIGNFERSAIGQPYDYALPKSLKENRIYLKGSWIVGQESSKHARSTEAFEDEVVLRYWARSVNLVIRPEGDEPFDLKVTLDGKPLEDYDAGPDIRFDDNGESYVRVDTPRLYVLVSSPVADGHELRLSSNSDAFAFFAFTFGVGEQD